MHEGFTFLRLPTHSTQQTDSQAVAVKARVKGKITKRGEGCEGEAFTFIMQGIKELRSKGEEMKAKIENSLMRTRARLICVQNQQEFRPIHSFPISKWDSSHGAP